MEHEINPAATVHHLPWFITSPGQSDTLLIAMVVFLVFVIIAIGNLYFQLHALPERWAHRTSPVQIQIVAVLALLALFTHNHIFWIAGLLLALVQFPDFSTPIYSIADSLNRIAGRSGFRPPDDTDPSRPLLSAPPSEPMSDEARQRSRGDIVDSEQARPALEDKNRPGGGSTDA